MINVKEFFLFSFLVISSFSFAEAEDSVTQSSKDTLKVYMKPFLNVVKGGTHNNSVITGKDVVFENLYMAGGFASGYVIDNNIRAEFESLFILGNEVKVDKEDYRFSHTALMINGYYDFVVHDKVSVYAGAGLGYLMSWNKPGMANNDGWDFSFAIQGKMGANLIINDKITPYLGYRLLYSSIDFPGIYGVSNYFSHNLEAGVQFQLFNM